jgi:hypothetical protein
VDRPPRAADRPEHLRPRRAAADPLLGRAKSRGEDPGGGEAPGVDPAGAADADDRRAPGVRPRRRGAGDPGARRAGGAPGHLPGSASGGGHP